MLTSADFITDFVPPDYLIDGIVQLRFIYSLTAPTGAGKTSVVMRVAAHVATGRPLNRHEVVQGKVLFLAGENPDDVRMRWIKLADDMEIAPDTDQIFWIAGVYKLTDEQVHRRIDEATTEHGPFALVVVDTSAAYFEGEDENSNTQAGNHARMLRTLTQIAGGPAVIVTCHPTKTPNSDNLVPRGGGAFLAEVDGNFVCVGRPGSRVVDLHWHGKLRGPGFEPIAFELMAGTTDRLKDRRGKPIWTVTARPITDAEREAADDVERGRDHELLVSMLDTPDLSLAERARCLGWLTKDGNPYKSLVNRTLARLGDRGLANKPKSGSGRWTLTHAGKRAAKEAGPIQPDLLSQADKAGL